MINVLHICEYLHPFGGTPRKILLLSRYIDRKMYSIIVAYHGKKSGIADEFLRIGVPVIAMKHRRRWDIRIIHDIVKLCRKHRVDIVATHFARANIYGSIAAQILGLPVISHEHGIPRTYNSRIVRFFDRITASLRDVTICNSHAVMQYTKNQLLAHRSNYVVVPNALDTNHYRYLSVSKRKQLRYAFGFGNSVFVFGFFGSFITQRDHETLVRAFGYVRKKYDHVRMLFVSDGPTRGNAEDLVKALALTDSVLFVGYRSDTNDLVQIIDAYVDTTSIAAGFAFSLMEAMYFAKPIITTMDIHPNDKIIEDCVNGLRVEPHKPELLADTMVRLMLDPVLAKELGANARKKILADCTPDAFVKRTAIVYKRFAGHKIRTSNIA